MKVLKKSYTNHSSLRFERVLLYKVNLHGLTIYKMQHFSGFIKIQYNFLYVRKRKRLPKDVYVDH